MGKKHYRHNMPRVLNKRYWPYQVTLPKLKGYITDKDPRVEWCFNKFNSGNWRNSGWDPVTFAFKRKDDATLFALVWS